MRWTGPNQGLGNEHDTGPNHRFQGDHRNWMVVKVWCENPGTYKVDVRNYHLELDGDNDVWVSYLGQTSNIPRMADRVERGYTWVDWNNARNVPLTAGLNGIVLAGRSKGFGIDRVAIFKSENGSIARNPDTPETSLYGAGFPTASFSAYPATGDAPLTVNFDASASTADGTIVSYAWDFGDGSAGTGVTPDHTFTRNGQYDVILTVTDDKGQQAVYPQTIYVVKNDPYGGSPNGLPGTVEAEYFDTGGQGSAYNDADSFNLGRAFRTGEGVDIEVCSDVGGGYDVAYIKSGEWLRYTCEATFSGTYTVIARVASSSGSGSISMDVNGQEVIAPVTVNNTGGWQNWQDLELGEIELLAGPVDLVVNMVSEGYNLNHLRFEGSFDPNPPVFDVSPAVNPNPVLGTNATVSALASDLDEESLSYTWSATGPEPVAFAGDHPATTATFTVAGEYVITCTVRSSSGGIVAENVSCTVEQTPSNLKLKID